MISVTQKIFGLEPKTPAGNFCQLVPGVGASHFTGTFFAGSSNPKTPEHNPEMQEPKTLRQLQQPGSSTLRALGTNPEVGGANPSPAMPTISVEEPRIGGSISPPLLYLSNQVPATSKGWPQPQRKVGSEAGENVNARTQRNSLFKGDSRKDGTTTHNNNNN